jgi:hypothetical protein
MILKFRFDKEKDLWNIWETCRKVGGWHDFSKTMPDEVVGFCRGKDFESVRPKILKYYENVYGSQFIPIYLSSTKAAWGLVESEFCGRLEKITGKNFLKERAIVYLTFATRCPYNYDGGNGKGDWFMFSFWSNLYSSVATIAHELMHFHFFDNYADLIVEEIGEEKMEDLKESLTVLLNLEFGDLWMSFDRGYDSHQDLRKFIVSQWEKKKDFDLLLKKCVEYLKNN